jgi:hypothetical protein
MSICQEKKAFSGAKLFNSPMCLNLSPCLIKAMTRSQVKSVRVTCFLRLKKGWCLRQKANPDKSAHYSILTSDAGSSRK